jgi:hypothetical protein
MLVYQRVSINGVLVIIYGLSIENIPKNRMDCHSNIKEWTKTTWALGISDIPHFNPFSNQSEDLHAT